MRLDAAGQRFNGWSDGMISAYFFCMLEVCFLARLGFSGFWGSVFLAGSLMSLCAQTDQAIYADSLQNGWQDWGWATLNYANSSPIQSGSDSISVTVGQWQAIYIAHNAFDSTPFASLSFWINGGPAGGQQLLVKGHAGGVEQTAVNLAPLAASS